MVLPATVRFGTNSSSSLCSHRLRHVPRVELLLPGNADEIRLASALPDLGPFYELLLVLLERDRQSLTMAGPLLVGLDQGGGRRITFSLGLCAHGKVRERSSLP